MCRRAQPVAGKLTGWHQVDLTLASIKKQVFISLSMLALASGASLLLFLNRPPTDIQEPEEFSVSVDVAQVVKQDLRIQIQAQGTVSPLKETSILSEVNGRIVEVAESFNVGGFVSEGDVLLRIDPRDLVPIAINPAQHFECIVVPAT